jgi:predicted enzyme related to lactoylglutathione lyase
MHHARLAGLIIDCKTEDIEAAAKFWGAALGFRLKPNDERASPRYWELLTDDGLHVEVQQVDHESRVHLDIESDDVEAEVRRLEALGAKRLQNIETWVVMEAPTGQRFCVVRPQRSGIQAPANRRS